MIFLKLGGSLITEKSERELARLQVIQRIADELAEARRAKPDLRILLGHGSGSFGHPPAKEFRIQLGVETEEQWRGAVEVWAAANRLHRIVIDSLEQAGVPAISFPPSAMAMADRGELVEMEQRPMVRAIKAGLIPVTLGDVVFDHSLGASVISTEQVMSFVAPSLHPERILFAGAEEGVYGSFPERDHALSEISAEDLEELDLQGAADTDVTGGMAHKVERALALAELLPDTEIRIFSGLGPGSIQSALLGFAPGTRVRA